MLLEIKELTDKNIGFISLSESLYFTNAASTLMFQILSAFCEFERNLISDRTKLGLQRAKNQGVKLGRRPGSKDKKKRRKSGYYIRQMQERQ